MAAIEEFSVGYPVKFWTGGDTTRDAFGKQIQEIERIYGILNALGTGKASYEEISSAINGHKFEANPHPYWKPSMSFNDLSGTVDAAKVSGLQEIVKENANGITNSNLDTGGYVKFSNGLLMQWATPVVPSVMDISSGYDNSSFLYAKVPFRYKYTKQCLTVSLTPIIDYSAFSNNLGITANELMKRRVTAMLTLEHGSLSTTDFCCRISASHEVKDDDIDGTLSTGNIATFTLISYLALGV